MSSRKIVARYKMMEELDESVQEELKQLIISEEYFDDLFLGLADVAHSLELGSQEMEVENETKEELEIAQLNDKEELIYSDDGEATYDLLDFKTVNSFSSKKIPMYRLLQVLAA